MDKSVQPIPWLVIRGRDGCLWIDSLVGKHAAESYPSSRRWLAGWVGARGSIWQDAFSDAGWTPTAGIRPETTERSGTFRVVNDENCFQDIQDLSFNDGVAS